MKKLLLSLIAVLVWPALSFANGNDNSHMFGWGHMMDWRYGGMFMWIPVVVVIVVVVLLITQTTRPGRSDSPLRESPMDILKRRYAKGEITKEEFQRMKKDLQG